MTHSKHFATNSAAVLGTEVLGADVLGAAVSGPAVSGAAAPDARVLDAPTFGRSAADGVLVDERQSVQWRSLRRGLWVGRSNDLPVGTIEQGHRYAVTGVDGETRGRFRRLEQAMHAFGPAAVEERLELEAVAAPSWEGVALAATIAGAAAIILATYGMLVVV